MSILALLTVYSLLTLLASLGGGYLPMLFRFTHAGTQMMMSFVAGLMLGVALFIMLPHAAEEPESLDRAVIWLMAGLLTMFFLLRAFHFHQHEPLAVAPGIELAADAAAPVISDPIPPHDHDHDHDHGHSHGHSPTASHGHAWNWVGVGVGFTLHSLMDGIAIAASVQADEAISPSGLWLGFGTFLAVLLHKPLDAMAITTLMTAGRWGTSYRQAVNAAFGLICPLGMILFYLGLGQVSAHENVVVSCVLAFSAGVFLCISLSDLLPEIQFHAHDRIKLSALLLLGVGTAYAAGVLEKAHHAHGGAGHGSPNEHEGHGHDHHHHE